MAQTLKFGKGTWATKTGSSMAYNDQNGNYKPLPFNVERDSIATRVNKEGLIEVVGKDKLRIDYKDSAKGVALLENSATNLVLNSQRISLTPTKNGTFTDDFAISPDGTQNATKLTATDTDPYFYQSVSFSAGSYTASIYVKGIGNSIGKDFQIRLGTNIYTDVIPSEWTRFEYTATMTSGSVSAGLEIPNPAVSGDEVLVWGWQIEANSFATSYIPTSGSTVQRQADVVNGSGNSEVFNDSEGVLFTDSATLVEGEDIRIIGLSDGSTNNRISITYHSTENRIQIYGDKNGTIFNLEYLNAIKTDYNKVAVKYNASSVDFYYNGFLVDTVVPSDMFDSNILNSLNFDRVDNGNNFYGKTKEIGYYDAVLTDEELEYMTSYRSLNELVTELNLNTL